MENKDHEQQGLEHDAVPASLLPAVLRRLGLEGAPTTHIEEQIATLRNEERRIEGGVALREVLIALRDPAWEVRAAAVWALRAYGEQAPVEDLLNALADEDGSVRAAVLRTLNGMSGHVSREPALRLLHDADWQVHEAALLTLEELGEQPQLYKEMETNLMARTHFNGYLEQAEQQKDSPAFNAATSLPSIDTKDMSLRERQRARSTPRHSRLLNIFNGLAAILVVGLIIVGSLVLFAHRSPTVGSASNISADIPFQPLPGGCFFLPQQDSKQYCPHDPFTKLHVFRDIAGYTITLKQAYADANQVLIEYTATKDSNHQPAFVNIGSYSTLRTQNGITLREGGGSGSSSISVQIFNFEPATIMPSEGTRALFLHLSVHGLNSFTESPKSFPPVTFDFSLPFHSSRVVIKQKTVTVAGKSVTLTQAVATPSETRFYLYSKDVPLDQDNSFSLTDNGRSVNLNDASVGGTTNQDGYLTNDVNQPITTEIVDFDPLFYSDRAGALTVSAPGGSHAGPWIFHFTV